MVIADAVSGVDMNEVLSCEVECLISRVTTFRHLRAPSSVHSSHSNGSGSIRANFAIHMSVVSLRALIMAKATRKSAQCELPLRINAEKRGHGFHIDGGDEERLVFFACDGREFNKYEMTHQRARILQEKLYYETELQFACLRVWRFLSSPPAKAQLVC